MSQRKEFVMLTITEEANMATLCRRFGISRKTGYKWFKRYQEKGDDGLEDQSRKPQNSPLHTSKVVEDRILAVRDKHPTWGGRKIAARLITLGMKTVPAASTITAILNRHGKIDPQESSKHKAFKRFEALHPNDLWQMDFKGHFGIRKGRCHPLTLLDDHSRYSLAVRACENEQGETVKNELIRIFQCYGLPMSILCDNGSPL
jgi:transposase InsO family protein